MAHSQIEWREIGSINHIVIFSGQGSQSDILQSIADWYREQGDRYCLHTIVFDSDDESIEASVFCEELTPEQREAISAFLIEGKDLKDENELLSWPEHKLTQD